MYKIVIGGLIGLGLGLVIGTVFGQIMPADFWARGKPRIILRYLKGPARTFNITVS